MIRALRIALMTAVAVAAIPCYAQYVTLTGTLQASNGLPASNYSISFTPSQMGFVAGTGVVVNTSTACATSTDGSVVGLPNPLSIPQLSVGFTGTLPPANYYARIAYYDAAGNITLASPEAVIQLNSTGRIIVAPPPSGLPAGAVGMKVYLSTTANAETLQGQTTGSAAFIQQTSLASGAALPSSNATICKQVANDSIWPVGTGYTVSLTDPSGNTLPGYPMQWQLMGAGSTINLSQGLPYYNGVVQFPSPILASPLNHALQSIAGPLSLSGYNLTNVGAAGFGTGLPAWPIDVENGSINASGGFLYNGVAPSNHLLCGNATAFVDCATVPASSISGLFYQTAAANGTAQTQRPTLNFTPRFSLTDSSSPAQTTVDMAAVGAAGTYVNPASITFDAYGRETAVVAGSAVSRVCNSNGCYRIDPDGTIEQWGVAASCGSGSFKCSSPVTFPYAFTTTSNLNIQVTPTGTNDNLSSSVLTGTVSTTGFTVLLHAFVNVGGTGVNLVGDETAFWYAHGN